MPAYPLEKQFMDLTHQGETAELGMWGFIATEVLFLGALFAAYGFYRYLHEAGIEAAARHTNLGIGAANTAVLLTSSFVMSWAGQEARRSNGRLTARLMWIVAALGALFLILKSIEYEEDLAEHLWPGPGFTIDTAEPRIAEVFYFLYWTMTGIHALHLSVGTAAVAFIARRAARNSYSRAYHSPVRVVSLYWHFVDIVWIFFFMILYLPGRSV